MSHVALDHPLIVHQIDIADELDFDLPPICGLQRQVLIADILLRLQFREFRLVGGDVFEETQLPDVMLQKRFTADAQQLDQKRIHIRDPPGFSVQNQDAIACRLEQPPVAEFRSVQRLLIGAVALQTKIINIVLAHRASFL